MNKEEAEQLGRQAAEADIADKIIDGGGNIIVPAMLYEHIVAQIIGKVQSTAAYIHFLVENRERLGIEQGDWKDDPAIEKWNGDEGNDHGIDSE